MTPFLLIWLVLCAAGTALSCKSVIVLGTRSRWTQVGWAATAGYFIIAGGKAATGTAFAHVDYGALALLTVAFVVAGMRDEPQAEPWWWPTHAGPTGRERRERR
jgi:hypothetical protein